MEHDYDNTLPLDDGWLAIEPQLVDAATDRLTAKRARLWSLVLEARYLPNRLEEQAGEWSLLVPPQHYAAACHELRSFERENRSWPPPPPPPRPLMENTLATLSVLLLLATFHNITRLELTLPYGVSIDWFASGSADAVRIRSGEWWRLVTALTLHSDVAHLLGNLCIGGVFVLLLCRELGSGLAWTLLLAAGSCGNAFNAWLHAGEHNSVGASTAVFAAVGILAALSLVRFHEQRRKRWMIPLAAALALLALLGTEGKQTDLGAHLFGFLSGIVFGLLSERLNAAYGPPRPLLNALLALFSALVVITAWLAAITAA